MRGEKSLWPEKKVPRVGSSPHARGKVIVSPRLLLVSRIIPACAGKRHLPLRRSPLLQDHPRMRGEKFCKALIWSFSLGSSPHARGKVNSFKCNRNYYRIIPACAGKSRIVALRYIGYVGSSPHARGKG